MGYPRITPHAGCFECKDNNSFVIKLELLFLPVKCGSFSLVLFLDGNQIFIGKGREVRQRVNFNVVLSDFTTFFISSLGER